MKISPSKIFFISAIIAAITFFINSVIQLIGYGLSTKAIPQDLSGALGKIISFIGLNFKSILSITSIITIITTTIIYFGFIYLSKKTKSKSLKIFSWIILIVNFLVLMLTLSIYSFPTIYSSLGISLGVGETTLGIIGILFGISLILWKNEKRYLSKSIGIFYILEGIILISTFFLPIRLADFTIAIRILEAMLFSSYSK